jgi:peptidyl-tRNA hydrolase, PTH1 family
LSGIAVRMLLERCECGPADLMLLTDDFALPWGMLRIRERGSSGGHNGLKSVLGAIGTDEFLRIRMGVQPERHWGDMADYLLCTMTTDQREIALQMVAAAAEAVEVILSQGPSRAMSRFNRRVEPAGEMQI